MQKPTKIALRNYLKSRPGIQLTENIDMPVIVCPVEDLIALMTWLYQNDQVQANCCVDICVVDHLHYGLDEWVGVDATSTGFERARDALSKRDIHEKPGRYEVVYHLLSTSMNQRYRIKVKLNEPSDSVPSVTKIWPNANWYEREAFDLFGIRFSGHPGLRRILTDYGFVGYPMRKDFPLEGQVEMRYDAKLERCLYEPVQVQNRVSVPKVIRQDDQRHTMSEV